MQKESLCFQRPPSLPVPPVTHHQGEPEAELDRDFIYLFERERMSRGRYRGTDSLLSRSLAWASIPGS